MSLHFKILGHPHSTCTARVLLTLAEKKHEDFELYTVNFAELENKSPGYLLKQPFGQIPVLEHGDFVLYESRAIARYIGKTIIGCKSELTNVHR